MVRIVGRDIPDTKRIEIALTYIYGVGPTRAKKILAKTGINPNKRVNTLSPQEIRLLTQAVDEYPIEGNLRQANRQAIQRLKDIRSYRGLRHSVGLPTRGQRTRSNARTRRGKRRTVGAMRKDLSQKLEDSQKAKK